MKPLTVLFFGATGRFKALAPLLLERGHQVLAATRHPASPGAQWLQRTGAQVVWADFDEPASLQSASARADVIVAAGTAHVAGPVGDIRHGHNIIDAGKVAGISHLVYITVAGASQRTGVPVIDSKHAVEQYLRSSGVPHTIVAPVYFMENAWNPQNATTLAAGRWPSPVSRSRPLQQIPVADLLAFTVHAVDFHGTMPDRVEIASDELTAEQATASISRLLGRVIEAAEPPPGEPNPLFAWLQRAGPTVDIKTLRRRYPQIRWHSFADWAATQDWRKLAAPGPVLPPRQGQHGAECRALPGRPVPEALGGSSQMAVSRVRSIAADTGALK